TNDEIGMPGRRDAERHIAVEITLRDDRIVIPGSIRAVDRAAAENHLRVVDARAAFRATQVVPALFLINMRTLNPHGLLRDIDAAIDEEFARTDHSPRAGIELLNPDRAMSAIERLSDRRAVVEHPRAT